METQSSQSPRARYDELVARGILQPDPAQSEAVGLLQALYDYLSTQRMEPRGWSLPWRRAEAAAPSKSGIYLWGEVGRGKSMLMDIFYDALPASVPRKRVHFHRFMREIHHALNHERTHNPENSDPMAAVVNQLLSHTKLLCLDEFQVHDITDAMILSRLFTLLLDAGLYLVTTSNRPPEDLYLHGLQRQAFLPFIDVVKQRLTVHQLQSPHDYRLQKLRDRPVYFYPDDKTAQRALNAIFADITTHEPKSDNVPVAGRGLPVVSADGVARTDFATLCREPRGAEDYEALAKSFHTVMLENIPALTREERNEAKRFVTLIDVLYDHKVRLICSAATEPAKIYPAGDGEFEFQRTVSRLMEMQSEEYLGASHIA
jgi:cell division protein ZapE